MTKEETKKCIEVMQAYVDGAEIEYNTRYADDDWKNLKDRSEKYSKIPSWDWINVNYRIKKKTLDQSVFNLPECPDWAECAAVDMAGKAFYSEKPPIATKEGWLLVSIYRDFDNYYDSTNWKDSIIQRKPKVKEVTMSDIIAKFGCDVKIIKDGE